MKTTTLQLLPTTTYGAPSGNYDGSSADFSGNAQPAASYYGGFGGLQTVAIYLNQFTGSIKLEATLVSTPLTDADWFRVYEFDSTGSTETTSNFSTNITGNFTWMRARVDNFDHGTINQVIMSY